LRALQKHSVAAVTLPRTIRTVPRFWAPDPLKSRADAVRMNSFQRDIAGQNGFSPNFPKIPGNTVKRISLCNFTFLTQI
jgi:hypothetical protein